MEMGYPRATPARADGGSLWHRESADKLPQEPPAPRTGAREPVEQSRAQDAPVRAGAISHTGGHAMDRILERVAGLDVHKKTVTACVRVPGPRGARRQEVR